MASGDGISKSQRIRDYISSNPDDKNKDIADALSAYGVTYGDVSNVKNQLKKAGGRPIGKRGRKPAAATGGGRAKKAGKRGRRPAAAAARTQNTARSITGEGMPAIQAGMDLLKKAGSHQEAINVLDMIQTIKSSLD